MVTALTASGEVPSAPVWFDIDDDPTPPAAADPARPLAHQRLDPYRRPAPALAQPRRERPRRPLDGARRRRARGRQRPPGSPCPRPSACRPGCFLRGDLAVAVVLGSTRDGTSSTAAVGVPARVPLSGRAIAAGPGRYRLDLAVAPSWARRACGRRVCVGVRLRVRSGHAWTTAFTDGGGGVSVLVPGPRGTPRVVARVTTAERRYRALRMNRIALHVDGRVVPSRRGGGPRGGRPPSAPGTGPPAVAGARPAIPRRRRRRAGPAPR